MSIKNVIITKSRQLFNACLKMIPGQLNPKSGLSCLGLSPRPKPKV